MAGCDCRHPYCGGTAGQYRYVGQQLPEQVVNKTGILSYAALHAQTYGGQSMRSR